MLTFHIEGIFRTPPGWNQWAGGPPNAAKDDIAPLSGVSETDWPPSTLTINWHFTRAGEWVTFSHGEPFAFFLPVQRGSVEAFKPRFAALENDPELANQFADWNVSRTAFHQCMADTQPADPSSKWQKFYCRGADAADCEGTADHQTKLRVKLFAGGIVEPPM